jgi:thiamine biosynthesis lipoprotein
LNKRVSSPGSERRRFLRISATGLATAALPALAASGVRLHVWRDVVMGADAEIRLYHRDERAARTAIQDCLAEVRRLESIFSLQLPDSALSRLNAEGFLYDPPAELVRLLNVAAGFSRATGGAFDITVQTLWELFAGHFAQNDADPAGPSQAAIASALAKVGYREITIREEVVAFARPGMSATLNGIAQGFVTDRATEILRTHGFENVLVNMGEMRALSGHPGGTPWRIGIADPKKPWRHLKTVDLAERAIATSGGYGTTFDRAGRHHHLFDPRTGRSAHHYRSVSVMAPDATAADALSTGLFILAPADVRRVVTHTREVSALLILADGRTLSYATS